MTVDGFCMNCEEAIEIEYIEILLHGYICEECLGVDEWALPEEVPD